MRTAGATSTDNGRNKMRGVWLTHGAYGRRIIRDFVGIRRGYEHRGVRHWQLHATKGWRCYRASDKGLAVLQGKRGVVMTLPDAHRLFAEAAAREHAALEDYARRVRAANDSRPPFKRDIIWQSPLLIGGAVVALIVGITLLARGMV